MKTIWSLSVLLLLVASVSTANAYDFKIGEKIIAQDRAYRRVGNDGASCQLQFLATLTVTAIASDFITVMHSSDRAVMPGDCEDGAMLKFEPHYLDTFRDQSNDYKAKKMAFAKIKQGVSIQSMNDLYVGDKYEIMDWRWAVVEENIGKFREGDLCRVMGPSYVEILGFYAEKGLVLLTYRDSGGDARECPEGTTFFEKP